MVEKTKSKDDIEDLVKNGILNKKFFFCDITDKEREMVTNILCDICERHNLNIETLFLPPVPDVFAPDVTDLWYERYTVNDSVQFPEPCCSKGKDTHTNIPFAPTKSKSTIPVKIPRIKKCTGNFIGVPKENYGFGPPQVNNGFQMATEKKSVFALGSPSPAPADPPSENTSRNGSLC